MNPPVEDWNPQNDPADPSVDRGDAENEPKDPPIDRANPQIQPIDPPVDRANEENEPTDPAVGAIARRNLPFLRALITATTLLLLYGTWVRSHRDWQIEPTASPHDRGNGENEPTAATRQVALVDVNSVREPAHAPPHGHNTTSLSMAWTDLILPEPPPRR